MTHVYFSLLGICTVHMVLDIALAARSVTNTGSPLSDLSEQSIDVGFEIPDNPDLELFKPPVATGEYEQNPLSDVLTQKLPNCELAQRLKAGIYHKTNSTLIFWDCMRCKEGYIEGFKRLQMPSSIEVGETQYTVIKKCEWTPCGSSCDTCDSGASFGYPFRGKMKAHCTKCESMPYGRNIRKNVVKWLKDTEGQTWKIKSVCTMRTLTGQVPPTSISTEKLLSILFNMFSPGQGGSIAVEKQPLRLVQILDHFVSQLTLDYTSNMQPKKEGKIGYVEKGNKYLEQTLEKAMAKLPESLVQNMGFLMASSRIFSELHGYFALCITEALNKMGDRNHNDTRAGQMVKGCDSVDNALTRLQSAALMMSKVHGDQPVESADFKSVEVAPRLALGVLEMFE